jgi:hypothetical protein
MMRLSHFLAPLFAQPCKISLSFSLVVLLLSSYLSLVVSPLMATAKHGCAPGTPSLISGKPVLAPPTHGSVLINEVLSHPASTWNCSELQGVFSQTQNSWIELYNPHNQPFDLFASHTRISLDGGTTWYFFSSGSIIAAGGFFVFFPENPTQISGLSWNAELTIRSTIIDQISVPILQPDQSYARIPDGSSNWQFVSQPTIGTSNNSSGLSVTSAPAKTPKPTRPPTPTKTLAGSGSGGSKTPVGNATQPAWSQVYLPSSNNTPTAELPTVILPSASGQTPNSPSASTQRGGVDSAYIVFIAALFVLLSGALLCYWRLFRTP